MDSYRHLNSVSPYVMIPEFDCDEYHCSPKQEQRTKRATSTDVTYTRRACVASWGITKAACSFFYLRIIKNLWTLTQEASRINKEILAMAPMAMNPDSLALTVDYTSGSPMEDDSDKSIAKGGVTTPFPWKLHDMLDDMARNGDHSVVTWQPHGRAFMVHKPKEFVEDIMPKYFNQTKYASFQRQLNLYGFSRLCHGDDKGAYYHMCFVRGKRNLCRNMVRQKIKGTKVRRSLAPDEEPNFYQPQWETSKGSRDEDPKSVIDEIPHSPHQSTERQVIQTQQPSSVVNEAMTDLAPPAPSLTVVPSSADPEPQVPVHPGKPMSFLNRGAKGGDLLFFEGQPFRYLEHIEKLPPPASKDSATFGSNPRPPLRPMGQWNPQEESVADMIDSIISSETTSNGGGEYSSVCCV